MLFRSVRKSPPGTYSCHRISHRERTRARAATHHSKIDILVVLEGIQQTDEPLTLGGRQDVSLCQDVADLIQLEQQPLAHDLQRAHLLRIFLLGQEHLTVASLPDLGKDLEVALAKTCPPLAEIGSLSASVFVPHLLVRLIWSLGRVGEFVLESIEAALTIANICEEIKVVVKEV